MGWLLLGRPICHIAPTRERQVECTTAVHLTIRHEDTGAVQTIVSNRWHPYFAKRPDGTPTAVGAEGHIYAGDIPWGAWVDAMDLRAGDRLQSPDGSWSVVEEVRIQPQELRAYNLSVDDFETFYVTANVDSEPVWVHNCPVEPYEVGDYNDLKARSAKGDDLDIHHVGQAHPMEQIAEGYDRKNAPAIALPVEEHRAIGTVRGPVEGSVRDQIAKDARDLRANTAAPNSAIQELIEMNKARYGK